MPGMDGTGPMGAGPMTGGGWGLCNPYGRSYGAYGGYGAYGAPRFGRGRGFRGGFGPGFGRGRGFGRGFGWRAMGAPWGAWGGWYGPAYGSPYPMNPEAEVSMLRDEAGYMKEELDAINKRIQELESESTE